MFRERAGSAMWGAGVFALVAATLGAVALTRGRSSSGRGRGAAQTPPTRGRGAFQPPSRVPTPPVTPGAAMPGNLTATYTPEFWAGALAPLAAAQHVPLAFAIAGLTEESGGNPCAIGNPEQYGPDGNPRELGPYQLYNPDDLNFLKISGNALRAYCNPAKTSYRLKDGRTVMGPSQEVIRPLTDAEVAQVAAAIIGKIAQSRSYAAHYATASHLAWPSDGVDFWRLVKLVHGLPGLVQSGLPNVTAFLGHAPTSWAEYRHCIESGQAHCDANTEAHRGADNFASIFDNAEKATATMQGAAVS